jgi:hypothetical protein
MRTLEVGGKPEVSLRDSFATHSAQKPWAVSVSSSPQNTHKVRAGEDRPRTSKLVGSYCIIVGLSFM